LSQIKGQKDFNLLDLLQKHQLSALEVRANPDLGEEMVRINGQPCARW
jgi:hypothetical protein